MSRIWYAFALIPLAICGAVAGVLILQLVHGVEGMKRGVMPATLTLQLEPGRHVVYAESESKVDGITYKLPDYRLDCSFVHADGKPGVIAAYDGNTTYAFGDFDGSAMFELDVAEPGAYALTCTMREGARGVVAIGPSIGGQVVRAVVLFFAGCVSGLIFFVLIWRRRTQWLAVVKARAS